MSLSTPKQDPVIRFIAAFGSFFLTLHWRIFKSRTISFGKNFMCDWRFTIIGPGKVIIGNNVLAWSREETTTIRTLSPDAVVTIGNNVRLNGCNIQANKSITIDDNSIVGSALLIDTDFHSMQKDRATNQDAPVSTKPIHLKQNVWVAGRCAILKGVTIGENSVVGFGSVVTRDIPSDSIAMGNPAQIVKKLD